MLLIDKHGERKVCDGCHRVRVQIQPGESLCDGCRQTGAQCAHCLARVPGAAEPRPGYFVLCQACEALQRSGSFYIPPTRVKRAI
jgi:hypothetical protein